MPISKNCSQTRIKLEKIADSNPMHAGPAEPADFYQPPTLTSNVLQPLDLQECKVPHLKDLIHISQCPRDVSWQEKSDTYVH